LKIDRQERKQFLARTSGALSVRDVNEHSFDPNTTSPPSLHSHEGGFVDETAMVIDSPELVLMGPLNLFDLYGPTDRMRRLAGFMALRSGPFPASLGLLRRSSDAGHISMLARVSALHVGLRRRRCELLYRSMGGPRRRVARADLSNVRPPGLVQGVPLLAGQVL
jgi:hypothetical protein